MNYHNLQKSANAKYKFITARKGISAYGAEFTSQKTVTFRVFAKHAMLVRLEIFSEKMGSDALCYCDMVRQGDDWVAEIEVDASVSEVLYGYRAWGKNWLFDKQWKIGNSAAGFLFDCDDEGNRYNPNKLLSDPYARELSHDPVNNEIKSLKLFKGENVYLMYASGETTFQNAPCRNFDNARYAPKSIAFAKTKRAFTKPKHNREDLIIYETHLKGLTMLDKSIPAEERGTFKGAAKKAKYLQELGITAIELLPIHEFNNEQNDINPAATEEDNYWGYMTMNYFSPDRRYSCGKHVGAPTQEFKEMVEAFHAHNIEVILDVVFNHTGEGGLWYKKEYNTANLHSFRGLDNQTYYERYENRYYYDNTGCGGNFNCANDTVMNFILDSLTYWAEEMGVDGFRFDLAPVLGNSIEGNVMQGQNGFQFETAQVAKISEYFKRRKYKIGKDIKLIAESWAASDGSEAGIYQKNKGYQTGYFPSDWSEWNDEFRESIRKFSWGVDNMGEQLRDCVNGSYRLFSQKTIDGKPTPNSSINYIASHDGLTLNDLFFHFTEKSRIVKSALTLLIFSRGIPMILGGDEFGRSQNLDANPYYVDHESSWFDWSLQAKNFDLFNFVKSLLQFRKKCTMLRKDDFSTRYTFYTENGDTQKFLQGACKFGFTVEDPKTRFYLGINMEATPVDFLLPSLQKNREWKLMLDTSNDVCNFFEPQIVVQNNRYTIAPKSCFVLREEKQTSKPAKTKPAKKKIAKEKSVKEKVIKAKPAKSKATKGKVVAK